ncbi:MAG: cysteine hydrolase, partial [Firmicutes bacterium]|nr:cysteine hydrolase [Bacillota bacterium]
MKVNDRYVSFYYENDNDYGPIDIDPAKTALLIVDMQHVFVTRPIYADTPEAQAEKARWEQFYRAIDETVLPNSIRLLEYFRKRGLDVFFAKI